jgi:luciferase family oxidoreductase group 1
MRLPLSILDLAFVPSGETVRDAYAGSVALARRAEALGYRRVWYAEHHNIPTIASSATSVLIAHVAAHTTSIRLGAGGIMLPNHAPLVIAEQFGTLESLYPGRIDLGLGRAPGGDRPTMMALRRSRQEGADTFPEDLLELMGYFRPGGSGRGVHAIPGEGLAVPIWLLGSSDYSARLAGLLGLPFAFASHFAPDFLLGALAIYRQNFTPSEQLAKPYAIVGVNVFAAGTDEEARHQFTSVQQAFLNLVRGRPKQIPPPVDRMDGLWSEAERAHVDRMTSCSAVGSRETVKARLEEIASATSADELIIATQAFDHRARLRSFEIAASCFSRQTKERGRDHHDVTPGPGTPRYGDPEVLARSQTGSGRALD